MQIEAKKLISLYGQDITINSNSLSVPISTKAFIQPLRSDYQSDMYGDYRETENEEQFLYIGLPEYSLSSYSENVTITSKNKTYVIKKSESVNLSGKPIYERAVLEEQTA